MRLNNRIYQAICPKCGKKFEYQEFVQEPGFRDESELTCPYCKELLAKSWRVDYLTSKSEED